MRAGALVIALVLVACQATTTRPRFGPVPGAPTVELELVVPEATRLLAEALREDSIPVRRVEPRDGLIESAWFETPGFAVTRRRPLGPDMARVRVWVDPAKIGHSYVTIETVYRVWADPSREPRELEVHVAETHPAAQRVAATLARMVRQYGDTVGR